MADPQISQITQTQTTIPEYARPYVENLLGTSASLLYNYVNPRTGQIEYDPDTKLPIPQGFQPYMQYQGERVAQFNPLQQQAFSQAQQMRAAPQLTDATALAGQAGLRALGYSYTPGTFTNQFVRPQQFQPSSFTAPGVGTADLKQYQLGEAERVMPMAVQSPQIQAAQAQYAPELRAYQMGPAQTVVGSQVTAPTMQAAQLQYTPELRAFQMGPAERVRTQTFARPGSAEAYMSPYIQSVVERQQQAAQREADIQNQAQKAQFAQAGAFGGGRFGVQQARTAEALARQKGDIQASGLQAAYQQAQQQFNAEQAARLQAQQANQQAGLTIGGQNLAAQQAAQQLGIQTGLQTGLANLNAAQQAAVQNQAAQLQAQGMTAQQALQAALANQQAGLQVGQQNLASALGTQQLGVQTGLQTALANLNTAQQAAVLNAANQLQASGMTSQQALQAALANQQAGLTTGQQNLAAMLGTQQFGAQQNLQAQLANQQAMLQAQQLAEQSKQYGYGQQMQAAGLGAQYGQAAQQLNEQSAQFGAGLGLQGLQTALQGAQQLGNLGQTQFGQNLSLNQLLGQYGGMQQQQTQNILNNQYQDFLNFQNYPYKQMGFMSDMLRGLPMSQTAATMYQAAPSTMSQVAGLGTAALGASKLFGLKDGGAVEDAEYREKPAGLADLAIHNMGR